MAKNMHGMKWLAACGALAAGEFAASRVPGCAEAWPVAAIAATLVALFGYGLSCRFWHLAFLCLLGAALFLFSVRERELDLRMRPWMRDARSARRATAPPGGEAAAVRRGLSSRVGIGLSNCRDAAALNRAMLLGERSGVPRHLRQTFMAAGTMHVFAISGLHVMAVARALYLLLRIFLFVPKRFAGAASIPVLWAYVWLIGAPPSAVRAAIMASFYCAAPLFWRKPDGMAAWSLAFFLVYLSDPSMIANVGCGLSFAVMLGIMLAIERMPKGASPLAATLRVSFAAWAAGAPIAGCAFGRIAPGSLVANLAVMPAACASVTAGLAGMAASFVSVRLAAHLNNVSALFTRAMVGVSEAVAKLPGASVETGPWPTWACCAWYAAALLAPLAVAAALNRRRRRPF